MSKTKSVAPATKSQTAAAKADKISAEDFQTIQNLKANAAFCKSLAQKAAADQRVAEVEVQNALLRTYMKYGMSLNDQLDNEGNILRVEVVAVPSQEEEVK